MLLKYLIVFSLLIVSGLAQSLSCTFFIASNGLYTCDMMIINSNYDGFLSIPGNHLAGKTHSDVMVVNRAGASTSHIVPKVICNQFTNLKEINFGGILLETLTQTSFAECLQLTTLKLMNNNINLIDVTTFTKTTNLITLDLSHNKIESLARETFNKTTLLQDLDLSYNTYLKPHAHAFFDLLNLKKIKLMHCGIKVWERTWFSNNAKLEQVEIYNNQIVAIPNDAFHPNAPLKVLYISNNLITRLQALSFGSLNSLESLYAIDNQIVEIEKTILTTPPSLSSVYLSGNICSTKNFEMFYSNRDYNIGQLSACTSSFDDRTVEITTDGLEFEWQSVTGRGLIVTVAAAYNAQLMISGVKSEDPSNPHVLFELGIEGNTKSRLISGSYNQTTATSNYLSSSEMRTFVLYWENVAQIKRETSYIYFLQYTRTDNFPVNFYAVNTEGTRGDWRIQRIP